MTFTPETPTVNDGNIGKGLVAETDLYLQHLERMDKAMNFTPQTPTEPDVYLFKFDEDSPPDVIRLGHDNSGELRTSNGSGVIARTLGGLWCRLVPADEALRQTNWQECAREYARNLDFYHGIVIKCGEQFGKAAYTSDDGSVQDSVLALKVPELVAKTLKEVARLKEEVDLASLSCAHCGKKPATCIGKYESMTKEEPACDDCCGHGNEDGYCEPISRTKRVVEGGE